MNCRNILCNRPVIVYFYNKFTTNLQLTCDWIVEIYYVTDLWSFILQQTYDRPVIELSKYIMTDLWLNCRNILCTRLVFVYFYNKLTTDLQQIYNKLTTDLRQTYNKLTTDFGIELWLNCRNILWQTYDSFEYLSYLFLDLKHD